MTTLAIPPPAQDSSLSGVSRRARRVRLVRSDPSITADEVRAALQRLLASTDFPASARNRKFLAYITETTIEGRPDEISGYKVATEAFGRPARFNPTTDPIVRIEAGKLRRDLEVYYLKSGAGEEIGISLPRGGYVPAFHRRAAGAARHAPPSLDPRGITVHGLHSRECALAQVEPLFRARLADRLARERELAIYVGPEPYSNGGLLDSDAVREAARRNGTRFVLSGDAQGVNGSAVITVRLHDGATGRLLQSEDITGHPATLSESVAERVAQMHRALAGKLDGNSGSPDFPA